MVKIVEYENVYLEYPEEEELTDKSKEVEEDAYSKEIEDSSDVIRESRTTRLSIEELQHKLEETQTLHL